MSIEDVLEEVRGIAGNFRGLREDVDVLTKRMDKREQSEEERAISRERRGSTETETDRGVDLGPGGQDHGVDSEATEPDHGVDPRVAAEQDRGVGLKVSRPEHEADLETIVRDRGADQVTPVIRYS